MELLQVLPGLSQIARFRTHSSNEGGGNASTTVSPICGSSYPNAERRERRRLRGLRSVVASGGGKEKMMAETMERVVDCTSLKSCR